MGDRDTFRSPVEGSGDENGAINGANGGSTGAAAGDGAGGKLLLS